MIRRVPRFAVPHGAITGDLARVTGGELHHMRDVMRLRPGSAITLLTDDGIEHAGVIRNFEHDCALITVSESRRPSEGRGRLILAAGLIKGPRMDFLVEKAAELGACELWPLICPRSLTQNPGTERLTRWRRIAHAAAKQSLAARPMEIRSPSTVADMIRCMPRETFAVVCSQGTEPLPSVIRRTKPHVVLLACGPEGDFNPDELSAMSGAGFVAAALSPYRLRSETAAMAALSITAALLDETYKES